MFPVGQETYSIRIWTIDSRKTIVPSQPAMLNLALVFKLFVKLVLLSKGGTVMMKQQPLYGVLFH